MAFLNPSPAELSRWAGFPGTESMAQVTATLEQHPDRVPAVLLGIVHALAD
jgi:hypothetical protein